MLMYNKFTIVQFNFSDIVFTMLHEVATVTYLNRVFDNL